jgi:chemotaxis receptor (MCP) glutamine deamidase CheD
MENECCKKKYLFSLDVSGNDVVKICYNNREKIINRLYSYDIAVSSHEKINDTTAKLVFTPKLFDIIIKDNRAYFYICKE